MVFELGKTYVFTDGKKMKIIGLADSVAYGKCLIGEDDRGNFIPVGDKEENTVNWKEYEENELLPSH